MRFHLPHIVAIEQPLQLLARQCDRLFIEMPRPRKTLFAFDHFVPHHKTIAVPPQTFDAVPSLPNEQKDCRGKWILLQHFLHQRCQARPLLPHVDRCAVQVYPPHHLFRSQHARLPAPAPEATKPPADPRTRSSSRCDGAIGIRSPLRLPPARPEPPQTDAPVRASWPRPPTMSATDSSSASTGNLCCTGSGRSVPALGSTAPASILVTALDQNGPGTAALQRSARSV